jgi:hypothetical protein
MADERETITLTIDGREVEVPSGTTILEAAQQHETDVPHVCYHDGLTPPAVCRVCVVEVEGARVLQAACVAECAPGMVVHTRSERVEASRRTILEMLDSAVDLSEAPELQSLLADYDADTTRFADGQRREIPLKDDNPFFMRADLRRGWAVRLRPELWQARLREPHHHLPGCCPARYHLRVLRAVRGRLPDGRAQAESRVGPGTGL